MLRYLLSTSLVLLSSWLLPACGPEAAERTLRRLVRAEPDRLATVSNHFLADSAVRGITLAGRLDIGSCESINSWRRCGRGEPWKKWVFETRGYESEPDVEAVLAREKIPVQTYQAYTRFLRDRGIHSIDRALECADCVDFAIGVYGLRYSRDTTYHLPVDHEYLRVERMGPNWHFYARDWN